MKEIKRSTIVVDGVFDIETADWDQFILGALYRPGFSTRVYSWRYEDRFVDDLLALKGVYWAHNGGRFDFLWLIRHLIEREIPFRISLSGSSIAGLFVGDATFRDSARLVPMSLAKGAQIGSIPKTEMPGGPDANHRGMTSGQLRKLGEYCVNDCVATYSMLDTLAMMCERWDLDLKTTIGASAWATVKRSGVEPADWGGKKKTYVTRDYTDARKAYFGGRTQVFRPEAERINTYDINSAYPAALANLYLPTGERTRVHGDAASAAFASSRPGIYCAIVHVPRAYLPPLPVRGKSRIGFPIGDFRGWWTLVELQAAMLRGTVVRRIDEAMVWDTSAMVLAPFCRHVWGLRDEAGAKTPLGTFLKLYANSLTGKLATKPEVERIDSDPNATVLCSRELDCQGVLCGLSCCEHRCTGSCGKREPVAADLPIFIAKYVQLSECSHVHWSAYLTAWTRAKLLDFAGDGEDGVYCDTDSWKCLEPRTDGVGSALGEWKDEGTAHFWESPAPKTYQYADGDGVAHGASKGIPDSVRNFHRLRLGVSVDRGVATFKSAVRAGEFFVRRDLTRAIRPDGVRFGDRVLGPDGRTYPVKVKQLADDLWEFQ